jgi:saccharopine dehydrogenase-like NADP-dependent oxidoreductase
MRILLVGAGLVGARAARHLASAAEAGDLALARLLVADRSAKRRDAVARSLGNVAESVAGVDPAEADLVILASPAATHPQLARRAVRAGRHVVSVADGVAPVEALLDLDAEANERGIVVAVGAGFAPGFSCVLARHAASAFDTVDEVHVAHHGTGGPSCARQHHSALRGVGLDWRDHTWRRRPPRSGRELSFFPDPIGGADCYRAALPDALLLVPELRGVGRVTARLAATRRDRLTVGLPMLRPPHPEGLLGGVRVEVRGRRNEVRDTLVYGAVDRPAVAAGTVAAVAARWIVAGRAERSGAAGLAGLIEPVPFLHELARAGVRGAVFEGG